MNRDRDTKDRERDTTDMDTDMDINNLNGQATKKLRSLKAVSFKNLTKYNLKRDAINRFKNKHSSVKWTFSK